ncbi:MAG: glycoside hydrolase family 95 protein [Candidatus Aminicenantes bacterium]|nr:glycoside hydrolase family 95 protein [Candidatus Aminicenantes bacterium]
MKTSARWTSLGPAVATALLLFGTWAGPGRCAERASADPSTVLWYAHPADKWENAFPVGNGRLGAMVFGKTDEEEIQLNEETYWSGGPYSTVVKGGSKALPEIRKLVFDGNYKMAHILFGRNLMGYPVEQMKYQSLGRLVLRFPSKEAVTDYRHELDLDTAVVRTTYVQGGVRFTREVLASPVDQVIVVRITADRPGQISFKAQLQGERNEAHSNYATDYFRMDGLPPDGLVVRGRSADYMGVTGALRYESRLKALPEGGTMSLDWDELSVAGADAVTLLIAAATTFVNYKDVNGDPRARVEAALAAPSGKAYETLKAAHLEEHRRLFRRAVLTLPATPNSLLPTNERLKSFDGANDPALGALVFQFGRYLLISSSRPGTQPANLQGIWNKDMNPMWDSKYTTNINTEMNYWPAEVGNLAECAEPLFRMIRELTDQGSQVARENYGARGWVFHQNTDLWRVAAPMDGPSWGTFTAGGAWLALPVHGRQGVPGRVLSHPQGQRRVLPGFPGPASPLQLAGDEPLDVAGELSGRPRSSSVLRRDHDLPDDDLDLRRLDHRHGHPQRPLRVRRPGRRYPGRRPRLQGPGPGGQVQAGAHADRAEGQPPGMARGLGRDREEPPPYLGTVGPVPGPPDLRAADAAVRRGQQGRPGAARALRERLVLGLEGRLLGPARGRRQGPGELHLRHAPIHDE